MKTEFKAKFLQHVAKRKREEGFTLIELLVVIIIIGILSAIALPSFLNQANKAKQSEAKQYLASINKGQQAYYTEKSTFVKEIDALGVGIKTQTTDYVYECDDPQGAGINCLGTANGEALQSYTGTVYLVQVKDAQGNFGESTSRSLLCETIKAGTDPTAVPVQATAGQTDLECTDANGMTDV